MTKHFTTIRTVPGACLLLALAAGCAPSRAEGPRSRPTSPEDANTGYTTEAAATSTVWASTVSEEELAKTPAATMADVLARVPGLTVNRSGSNGLSVRVRGMMTLTGNPEPLFVVDGVMLTGNVGPALESIPPSSIRRIDVLKDSGSLAMYGSRGANGVVLISTLRGR